MRVDERLFGRLRLLFRSREGMDAITFTLRYRSSKTDLQSLSKIGGKNNEQNKEDSYSILFMHAHTYWLAICFLPI